MENSLFHVTLFNWYRGKEWNSGRIIKLFHASQNVIMIRFFMADVAFLREGDYVKWRGCRRIITKTQTLFLSCITFSKAMAIALRVALIL